MKEKRGGYSQSGRRCTAQAVQAEYLIFRSREFGNNHRRVVIRAKAVFGWRRISGGISLTWQAKQSSNSLIGMGNSEGRVVLERHYSHMVRRYFSGITVAWSSGITAASQSHGKLAIGRWCHSRMVNQFGRVNS